MSLLKILNDGDEGSVRNLLALLVDKNVVPQGDGGIVWSHDSKGSFTLKCFCNILHEGSNYPASPAKPIWKSKDPPKVFFSLFPPLPWVITKEKTPMKDMLKRRSFYGPCRCSLCLEKEG